MEAERLGGEIGCNIGDGTRQLSPDGAARLKPDVNDDVPENRFESFAVCGLMRRTMSGAPPTATTVPAATSPRSRAWLAVFLVIAAAAAIRSRLLELPLERDEGEYAYAGQLLLQGVPPYQLACNMKLPGTYAAYALLMAIFGETPAGIHLGLIVVNSATITLVFLLARRLLDELAGVVAAVSYALMSLSPGVLGTAGHATHFVLLPALCGVLLLLRAIGSNRFFLFFISGLLFGLAFVMKQPGALFGAFGLAWLLWVELRRQPRNWRGVMKQAALFLSGWIAPFALVCAWLWLAGEFEPFWFWTVEYAREYATRRTLAEGWREFWSQMVHVTHQPFWLWALAGAGGILAVCEPRLRGWRSFIAGFAMFSFLAVCPGLYFRLHYFILMLPVLALLTGIAVSSGRNWLPSPNATPPLVSLPLALFVLAAGDALWRERAFLFTMTSEQACRRLYGSNPFLESAEVARHIREHSDAASRVAVIGSEPQIYFLAQRRSATSYIYAYPLVEPQPFAARMQAEMIRQIESAQPEFVVVVKHPGSWLAEAGAEKPLFNWVADYCNQHCRLDGVVEITLGEPSRYWWGKDAQAHPPATQRSLLVFRRRNEAGHVSK